MCGLKVCYFLLKSPSCSPIGGKDVIYVIYAIYVGDGCEDVGGVS